MRILGLLLALTISCSKSPPAQVVDRPGTPEATYRAFMLANLEGVEARVRPLIVDRPDSDVLWQGAYPPAVATMLTTQYRSMEIVRASETPEKVTLTSTASPIPLDVIFDSKVWRLDPAPIIAVRKKTARRP